MNTPFYQFLKVVTRLDILAAEDGCCPHIVVGTQRAHLIGESDNFGPVFRRIVCNECHAAIKEAVDNEKVVCNDCGGMYRKADTEEYHGYGFSEEDGDDPLIICKSCLDSCKHQWRLEGDLVLRELDSELEEE